MNNNFGSLLKELIIESNTKEKIVSQKLGYDSTYLSKWITGKNLPSQKNVESICQSLAEIFSENKNIEEIKSSLIHAYYSDLGFSQLESNINKNISVTTTDTDVTDLILEILQQLEYIGIKDITINTTLNLFQDFEYHMETIIAKLHNMDLESLKINMCASFDNYEYNPIIFCNNILSLASGNFFIDFNIYKQNTETPKILVINDVFALNIVHLKNVVFLCYYSFDKKYIEAITNSYSLTVRHMEKVLSYVMPISLRKTNVQLNQFIQNNMSILFSESPAILIPKGIINNIAENNKNNIEKKEWEEYTNYITQISNVFEKYTKNNNVKILIYESMLLQYINSGAIEIGGQKHVFTKEQIKEHILNICKCMKENENIEFYTISDTINFDNYSNNKPSIFLSPITIAVGNTNIYTDTPSHNFYFSTEDSMIKIFEKYLDTIMNKSSCVKISADRLATYLV